MDLCRRFAELHRPGHPLILFNIWDAGSARAVAAAGAKAIATGSHPVSAAFGFEDGERIPLDLALDNLRRIVAAVDLPVTLDFEGGYARAPGPLGDNAAAVAEAGAVGCNFEDRVVGGEGLVPIEEQCARIAAIAARAGAGFFINARTDVFVQAPPERHAQLLDEALERGRAYAEAGASGLFLPLLLDEALIARACAKSPLPVNILVWPGAPPIRRMAELGVARISYGGRPHRLAMEALAAAAKEAMAW
jgi:2-methylisocitrate lyase-like PEP mutase family enzyme